MALTELTLDVTLQRSGVTYSQDGTTPVFTVTDDAGDPVSHDLTVGAEISVTKSTGTVGTPSNTTTILGTGQWNDEGYYWEFGSGKKYVIASVEKTNTFTVEGEFDTSADETTRTIEYHPTKIEIEEVVVVEEVDSGYEWAQVTLGQNDKIAEVAAAAEKASVLVGTNLTFVKTTLELGKVLLLAALNPQLILLIAIADEIDNFVEDLKGTGFFILNVTPTGFEVNPRDQDGNRIKLSLGTETLKKSYADAVADGPETLAAFIEWSTRVIGVKNPPEGFVSSKYEIEQGKSEPDSIAAGAIATDLMVQKDALFGFAKMTPSQIIATMIAAMDDPRDPDRPQLSDSADVAALIIIIGFSDLTKIMKPLYETMDLFMSFFGGENSQVMKAVKGIRDTVKQAQDFLDIPDDCQSTITVGDVCGVRGTEDDREILRRIIPQSEWNESASNGSEYYYNYADQFEEGDFVAGPTNILTGNPSLGYVREVLETTQDEEDAAENVPYVTQKLLINCMSGFDKDAFDSFSNGKILQKVAYVTKQETKIDNNTGLPIKQPERISFKYMKDLNNLEALPSRKLKDRLDNIC